VLAASRPRADWADRAGPDVAGLTDRLREEAGAYWLHAARMELASVASFARFVLELRRFGAPRTS
jgi:hypothetical protein